MNGDLANLLQDVVRGEMRKIMEVQTIHGFTFKHFVQIDNKVDKLLLSYTFVDTFHIYCSINVLIFVVAKFRKSIN